jgi:spermidine/putrescine-binding protein
MDSPLRLFAPFLATIALILSSCRDQAPPVVSDPEVSSEPASERSDRPLTILTWDEYFSPAVVERFEKEHGIPVEFVTFSNLEEMQALLRSRPAEFDLLVASGGTVADLIELQLVQPLQRERIPLAKNLDSRFLGLSFDPANDYSLPYMWGTTLIAYRADKIQDPVKSWNLLWEEEYRGRILMVDDGFDVYAAALLAKKHDLNSQDPAHIEEATASLLDQVDRLNSRFVDIFEVRDKLISGDCWISMTYSSDAAVLAEEEDNIAYFIPEEGAPLWVDSFVIPRESTNSEAAHRFLDYLCRAEIAAENSNELWCASANREARAFLSKEILEDPTIYLEETVMSRCRAEAQSSPQRQLLMNQGLKKVFDRVREISDRPGLSLLIWDEYIAPEVVAKFENECNARLLVTEVDNSEQLKQELASAPDRYDVVVTDEQTLRELIQLKLLKELALPESEAAPVRSESFLASPADPGNGYSVPYLWGLTVIAGKTKVLEGVEPSWNLIWREDLRIALLDEPSDLIWIGLLALGYDPAEATPAQIEEAASRIGKRFPDLKHDMKDLVSGLDALEADEIDLLVTYNGDAISRAEQNPAIRAILPAEGAPLWVDSFAIPRDAPSPELASRFIHFMTTPENSALSANALHYASPNPGARERVEPRLLSNEVLYPRPELAAKCRFVRYAPELEKTVRQAVVGLVSGHHSRTMALGGEEAAPAAAERKESEGTLED